MPSTSNTVRNSSYNFLSYVIPIFLTIFLTPLIINRLGVDAYGIFMLANIAAGLFSLLRFGMGYGVAKTISAHFNDKSKIDLIEGVMNSTLTVLFAIGCVGALGLIAIGSFGGGTFNATGRLLEQFPLVFALAGLSFVFLSASSAFTSALVAVHRADVQAKLYLVSMVLMNGAMIIAVYAGGGVVALMAIQAVFAAALIFSYWVTLRSIFPALRVRLRYSHAQFSSTIRMNVYVFIHELSTSLLMEFDKIMLGAFLTPAAVSYYSVSGTIGQKIQGSLGSMTAIFLPVASTGAAQGDMQRVRQTYRTVLRLSLVVGVGLAVTAAVFGEPLLQYWLGPNFVSNALIPLYILCATYLLLSVYTTLWHFLLGIGAVRFVAYATLTFTTVNVILLIPGIRYGGIVGAALAYLLSLFPLPYILARGERQHLGLADTGSFFLGVARNIIVPGMLYGATLYLVIRPLATSLIGVILLGSLALFGHLILMRLLGQIQPAEWERVRSFFGRLFDRPIARLKRLRYSEAHFATYERDYLLIPGATDTSFSEQYAIGNLVRLAEPMQRHYEELLQRVAHAVAARRSSVIIRVSDGEAHFLAGQLVGNGPRRHYTSGVGLDPKYIERFRAGLLACESRHVEMYKNNQMAFQRIFGKNIFSEIPFETLYALVATRWIFKQPYRIGLIGSEKKLGIIKQLLTHAQYREYLGRENFDQFIGVPDTGTANDVDRLIPNVAGQLDPNIDVYLVGIGIAKMAVLPEIAKNSRAVFVDVGAGLSALAGLVSHGRPYFGGWINFRLKDFDYTSVDQMDFGTEEMEKAQWL